MLLPGTGKDKYALDKMKSLGYDRITSLANEAIALKKGDVILIIKNNAYIHPNPDDDRVKVTCPEMMELLSHTGRTGIQNIPRYKLDGFLKQEKEDIFRNAKKGKMLFIDIPHHEEQGDLFFQHRKFRGRDFFCPDQVEGGFDNITFRRFIICLGLLL